MFKLFFTHQIQHLSIFFIFSLLLSACAAGPDYHKPAFPVPNSWQAAPRYNAQPTTFAQKTQATWWENFHDTTLNTLISTTLKQNYDRKIVATRILEARAQRMYMAANLFPDVSVSSNAARANLGFLTQNENLNLYQANFDARYEIDLFGGNRRQVEAADARIQSREASYHDITLSLVAEIINEYATLRELQQRYIFTTHIAQNQKRLAELMQVKFQHGAVSGLEVNQANAQYQNTAAELPMLDKQTIATMYRISVLTGTENNATIQLLTKSQPIPYMQHAPMLDSPVTILSRRPDIIVAERNLAENTALTAAAISQAYPKITLSGLFGAQNTSILPSINIWSLASSITMPLLNFGKIQGNIDSANAQQKAAFFYYQKTIIAALNDVKTKLSDYQHHQESTRLLTRALKSNQSALTIALKRNQKGMTPLIDVLDAESKVYTAQNLLLISQANEVRAIAALQKAAGL